MSGHRTPAARFLACLCQDHGYTDGRLLDDARYAAVAGYAHATAIIEGRIGDGGCFVHRWCYPSARLAREALAAWDGRGTPTGWAPSWKGYRSGRPMPGVDGAERDWLHRGMLRGKKGVRSRRRTQDGAAPAARGPDGSRPAP